MKNKKSNTTSKKGINFVRSVVEDSECFFHKIEQENDLGIDAIIELIKDERPINLSIAFQIKSGSSYYNHSKSECIIPIDSHRDYWQNYSLPVFGIVYIPTLKVGYWIDIKHYLKTNKDSKTIKFIGNRANLFDFENFNKVFIPQISKKIPDISLQIALQLFDSEDINEFVLGRTVLFRRYVNDFETWDRIVGYIKDQSKVDIPYVLIYYLAHIPWHPDIWHVGETISDEIKKYVLKMIKSFDRDLIIKLLSQMNEDDEIRRGSIGQSIEAIISVVENKKILLESIILDESLSRVH